MDYSYYKIKDYVVTANGKYRKMPKYSDHFNYVPKGAAGHGGSCRYNLDEMIREGIEVSLDGHLLDNLSFYLNYVYLELKDKEGVPWGKDAVDERAKHRVNAGLRYNLFKNTLLMLDYKFQDEQIAQTSEQVGYDEYIWYTVPMAAYHVFDFAIEQTLFKKYGYFKDAVAKFYINNLFDEEYENRRGYPMTDCTCGGAISFRF